MKKIYEPPVFDLVTFEASEAFATLSSFVDPSDNGNKDNEIDNSLWNWWTFVDDYFQIFSGEIS